MLPLEKSYITSAYGEARTMGVHTGIDLISKSGNKYVKSVGKGTVRLVAYDKNGYGNYVSVQQIDGTRLLYCHLASVICNTGDELKEGDLIGIEGTTGNSTGVHLHLEARKYPYGKSNHTNIATYLGIENNRGEVKMIEASNEKRYNLIDDVPDWAKPTIEKLIKKGALKGDDSGLDLSYDMMRMLVIHDRLGLYGE